jgi:hypothetical protein
MLKDPALFWEIFAFGISYLGSLMWMLTMLVWTTKEHTRRIALGEKELETFRDKDLEDLKKRVSTVEVHLAKYDGADEVKGVVREFLERIEKKGDRTSPN